MLVLTEAVNEGLGLIIVLCWLGLGTPSILLVIPVGAGAR